MKNERISEKKAKGLVYNFIVSKLNCKRNTLHKQTQRARWIYKLFEKIGIDKIKYIKTYSANSISELTNDQIQTIVANTELPDNQQSWDGQDSFNNSLDDLSETEAGEGVEKTLPETEVNILTAPVPYF